MVHRDKTFQTTLLMFLVLQFVVAGGDDKSNCGLDKRMEMVVRNKCALTGAEDLELLLKIADFPISMHAVDFTDEHEADDRHDIKADMQWWISRR